MMGTGGKLGPELDGSVDAENLVVDSAAPDVPDDVDAPPSGNLDVAADAPSAPDLARDTTPDLPITPADAADPLRRDSATLRRDTAPDAVIDTRPPLTLLWSDEFEGAANTGVDTSKWSYVTWAAGQVNNEKQRYTANRENVYLDGDGNLVLRALKSATEYTSGRIETNGIFSFKTGRIEVRAKLPAGIGSFPGIVMMGTSGGWPECGEIGLMEQWGQDKSCMYASAYADSSANSGDKRKVQYDFANATTASTEFHIYSADWYSDYLVIQVDGQEVMRTSFGTNSPFYTTPEYIILDVAVGGNMGGTIDQNGFPMDMVVDYVRVYSF
jgi:beta-glucanase (GH16 family)